jgi:hypothetical protein
MAAWARISDEIGLTKLEKDGPNLDAIMGESSLWLRQSSQSGIYNPRSVGQGAAGEVRRLHVVGRKRR